MELVARAFRFVRSNPVVFLPLLVHWALQCTLSLAAAQVSGEAGVWLEPAVGLVWLALPLFLAATEALILGGLDLGRASTHRLFLRALQLSLRAALSIIVLLMLAQFAWRLPPLPGLGFFLGMVLIFSFLPEALYQEANLQQALERSMCLLQEHPVECLEASGAVVALGLATYVAGLWHLEGQAGFDVHLIGAASPLMALAHVAGVTVMVYRALLYRSVRLQHAVGMHANW